jgi:hypothetical protein
MSHGMLHHIEPKYFLNCCTYLIWFEFETWFEFELKTLEKINRKGNRNSKKKEKTISAQASPISLAPRAPSVPDRWAPPIGANPSALTPSLSRCSVGPSCRRRSFPPRSISLSRCPHLSAVPNLSLTISPPRSRPRPRVLRPRPCARAPFEPRALLTHLPSLICALCQTLSPSLSLCPGVQGAPPPLAVDRCLFCGYRRVRAPSSATVSSASLSAARDTLRCALPLSGLPGPRTPERFLRSRSPAAIAPSRPYANAVAS